MAPFKWSGFKNFFLRVLLMPSLFFFFWIFYYDAFREGMDVSFCVDLSSQSTSLYQKLPIRYHFLNIASFFQENNQFQATFVTRNGLVFNSLAGAYFTAIIATATTCKTRQTQISARFQS